MQHNVTSVKNWKKFQRLCSSTDNSLYIEYTYRLLFNFITIDCLTGLIYSDFPEIVNLSITDIAE